MPLTGPSGTSHVPPPKLPKGAKLQLRILGRQERVVALGDDAELTVGKSASSSIVIDDDPGISARHLTLTRTAFGLIVSDPGSTNGTWVVFPGQHQGGSARGVASRCDRSPPKAASHPSSCSGHPRPRAR